MNNAGPIWRWRCEDCGWIGIDAEIDRVKDPKSETLWNICPACRSAESFENLCDEPGCNRIAGSGWPSPLGYRRTCFDHSEIGVARRNASEKPAPQAIGGYARAKALSKERRKEIAINAARARWGKAS
jgi:rubredoxin